MKSNEEIMTYYDINILMILQWLMKKQYTNEDEKKAKYEKWEKIEEEKQWEKAMNNDINNENDIIEIKLWND